MINVGQFSADGKWQWDGTQWVARSLVAQPDPLISAGRNNLAVASLVMGITCWFVSPFVGGILAVVSGHQARREIRSSGESGAGMAVVGLVLGYLNIVVYGAIALFWLLLFGGVFVLADLIASFHH